MAEEVDEQQIDIILSILENPIRRKILQKLSRDTNYPLQLSKELNVSQQAIMKHLKVLERGEFVDSCEEKSSKGGPPRKVYTPRKRYSIRIDIGPHTYSEKISSFEEYGSGSIRTEMVHNEEGSSKIYVRGKLTGEMKPQIHGTLPAFTDPKLETTRNRLEKLIRDGRGKEGLQDLKELISGINFELNSLEERRKRYLALRERAFEEANRVISSTSEDYLEKEIISLVVKDDIDDLDRLSDMMNMRKKILCEMIKDIDYLLFGKDG